MSQLQLYVDSQLEEINPFKLKSQALLKDANALKLSDAKTVREATALRKQITGHKTAVAEARKEITRQFDEVKSQFIEREKDVLKDAEKAQKVIQEKIIDYENEQEQIRLKEEARVNEIVEKFEGSIDSEDEIAIETEIKRIGDVYEALPAKDQENADIKLAYSNQKFALLELLDELMLGVSSDEAETATAIADSEDAELELKLKKKAKKLAPKTGIKMVTKFEVTDPNTVPRQFLEPVDKLIRAFIKENPGVDIPGVKIWQEKSF